MSVVIKQKISVLRWTKS